MMTLDAIHKDIDRCRICDEVHNISIQKAQGIVRGSAEASIFAIGMAPSGKAIDHKLAFAGSSFRRLSNWFSQAGFVGTEAELRSQLYLTSLIKCGARPDKLVLRKRMFRHCQHFLWDQIEVVRPQLILLLGEEVIETLVPKRQQAASFGEQVGTSWTSEQLFGDELIPLVSHPAVWLALPHPSGLSRTMNDEDTRNRVIESLRIALMIPGLVS